MLIKELQKVAYKDMSLEEWKGFETELEEKGYIIEKDYLKLSEILELDESSFGHSIVLFVWRKTEEKGLTWRDMKGFLDVYVTSYGAIRVETFIPNAPAAVVDSDINRYEIYKTEEGYFVPRLWKLFKEIKLDFETVFDLPSGIDGALRIKIKGEEI